MEKQAIAIIDLSNTSLTIIDVDDKLNSEEIEEILIEKGFHLSNCSWGAFDGIINDERDE